jgi:signal transduction histidine kinase
VGSVPAMPEVERPEPRQSPIMDGAIGELFHATPDAVIVLADGAVLVSNEPANRLLGASGQGIADKVDLPTLLALPMTGMTRCDLRPIAVVDVLRRRVGDVDALILRDVTTSVRHEEGLRRVSEAGRMLLSEPPSIARVLQSLVTAAKELVGAQYSALVILKTGSTSEISHFVYDAPRHLFPERMPRIVGLLAVPINARGPARLDDMRGHPAGVGLPGVHPPMGPLIAVPILAGEEVIGELAVANSPEGRVFDEVDEQLVVDLAAHVGVAYRWAQQAERIRELELMRQEVVDTARHDIRTPLGAGKGYALLLARKLDRLNPEQIAVALEGLVGSFDRIESFTERLLMDERQELVGVDPHWSVVDVLDLLDRVRRDVEVTTGREALSVVAAEGCPIELAGDAEMVREVIDNLVGNALKHSAPDALVVVTVRQEGSQVRIDVRDSGPGIPESEQAALFERWSRTDSSRARQVPGFGLGLSIVKRLVTAHGGTLGVSSRPGDGATFWVAFPTQAPA